MHTKKLTIYIVCFNEQNDFQDNTIYANIVKDVISTTLYVCEKNCNDEEFIKNYIVGFITNNGYNPKFCDWIVKKEKEEVIENTLTKSIFIKNYML